MPEIKPAEVTHTIKARTSSVRLAPQTSQEAPAAAPAATPSTQAQEPVASTNEAQAAAPAAQDKKLEERTRKEKELFRDRRTLQQERQKLAELQAKLKPALEVMELASQGKQLEALAKAGISYDSFTEAQLAKESPTPEQIAESKAREITDKALSELRAENEKLRAEESERILTQTRKQLSRDVKDFVATNEAFPLINAFQGFDTVAQYVEQHFNESGGEIIPLEAAAKEYEDFVFDALSGIMTLEPVRRKFGLSQEQQAAGQALRTHSQQPQSLTNRAVAPSVTPRRLTAEERRQRALDVFHGKVHG